MCKLCKLPVSSSVLNKSSNKFTDLPLGVETCTLQRNARIDLPFRSCIHNSDRRLLALRSLLARAIHSREVRKMRSVHSESFLRVRLNPVLCQSEPRSRARKGAPDALPGGRNTAAVRLPPSPSYRKRKAYQLMFT